jgi:hypothetical protein
MHASFYNLICSSSDVVDILAEIHDRSETMTQIKVQENGEYI